MIGIDFIFRFFLRLRTLSYSLGFMFIGYVIEMCGI